MSDATLLFLLVVGPIIILVAAQVMEAFGAQKTFLDIADRIDGIWLVIAVGVICFDSLAKLIVISVFSWREVIKIKP
jgi:hypothetical protein